MSLSNLLEFDQSLKKISLLHCGQERLNQKELDKRIKTECEIVENRYLEEIKSLKADFLEKINTRYDELEREIVSRLPGLVDIIVKKVLGDINIEVETIKRVVDEVIAECKSEVGKMEIKLCQQDFDIFMSLEDSKKYSKIEFVVDDTLEPGDCVLRSDFGVIDGRVGKKLERIQEEIE